MSEGLRIYYRLSYSGLVGFLSYDILVESSSSMAPLYASDVSVVKVLRLEFKFIEFLVVVLVHEPPNKGNKLK